MFQPGFSGCMVVMLLFCGAAAVMNNYYLAGAGLAITTITAIAYAVSRNRRNREIQAFVQEAFKTADITARSYYKCSADCKNDCNDQCTNCWNRIFHHKCC